MKRDRSPRDRLAIAMSLGVAVWLAAPRVTAEASLAPAGECARPYLLGIETSSLQWKPRSANATPPERLLPSDASEGVNRLLPEVSGGLQVPTLSLGNAVDGILALPPVDSGPPVDPPLLAEPPRIELPADLFDNSGPGGGGSSGPGGNSGPG
jgi:hypothetical protein